GSTDNSLRIANNFSKSDELSRFIIFNKKNEGTSLTRNLKRNIFIIKLGWKMTKLYLKLRLKSKEHRSKIKHLNNKKFTLFD
ncbi:hypothetical protein, partial [uncultured Succinatimonas sp.]|uniref:hypothetical protein n=1 Tax=uncultured Succinatimonas sp. TaxID=1262973 RepID=UPI002600906F